jgi:DNA-directed RNA polymerase specialized sigma24 family protein
MNVPDERLLTMWTGQRNAEAFAEIAARHAGMVYGVCARRLGAAAAPDAARACFVDVAQTPRAPGKPLAVWLHALAVEQGLASAAAATPVRRLDGRLAGRVNEPRWEEVKGLMDDALASLPDKLSEALILRFLEGHPSAAVAQDMGLARETLEQRLDKGLEQLRRALEARGVALSAQSLTAMLAANAVEACPATLTGALTRLASMGTEGTISLADPGRAASAKRSNLRTALYVGLGIVVGFLAVAGALSMRTTAPPPAAPALPQVEEPAAPPPPVVPPQEVVKTPETPLPVVEPALPEPALAELLTAALAEKLTADKMLDAQNLPPLSSRDVPPDNAVHFFLLATELLPEMDRRWLGAKWAEALAQGWTEDPELRAMLEASQEALKALAEGLKLGNALLPGPRGPGEPRLYLEAYGDLAKVLGLQAMMSAAEGNSQGALNAGRDLMLFAWESARGGGIDHGLAAYGMGLNAIEVFREVLPPGMATPEEYRFALEGLQRLEARTPALAELAVNEAQTLDEWGRISFPNAAALRRYLLDSAPDARLPELLAQTPDAALLDIFHAALASQDDIKYLSTPYPQIQREDAAAMPRSFALLAFSDDGFVRLPAEEARLRATLRGQVLTTAVDWFGAEYGRYPASLEELAPAYLPALPKDPFTGQGFLYQPTQTGYLLYSAGNDLRDSGGGPADLVFHRD